MNMRRRAANARALFLPFMLSLAAAVEAQTPAPVVGFEADCELQDALIGDTVTLDVTFDNIGAAGFGPFIDLVLDYGGKDVGSVPCDGLSFVSAQMISSTPASNIPVEPLQVQNALCQPGGDVVHPYASSGVSISGMPPGAQLATLKLLFGSVEATQPQVRVRVTLRIHRFADLEHPLKVYARGGFRYGNDPVDVAGTGQPVLNPPAATPVTQWPSAQVTPRVMLVEKKLAGPENEVVPGPNFVNEFDVNVRVAPGQTVTNVVLSDTLLGGGTFLEVLTGRGTVSFGGDEIFFITYPSLTGPSGGLADVARARFFATEGTFACVSEMTNEMHVPIGEWKPEDPRDDVAQLRANTTTTVKKKTIALVKTAEPADPRGTIPGNAFDYRIDFRISDYTQMRDLVIDDELSDGLRFVSGSATFTARDNTGAIVDAPFPSTLISTTAPVTGTYLCVPTTDNPCRPAAAPQPGMLAGSTRLRFLFSQAMMQQPATPFPTGTLSGGSVTRPPPLTPGLPATGILRFRAEITDRFAFGPHGSFDDGALDKHDPLLNRAEVRGTVVRPGNPTCSDDSTWCTGVAGAEIQKHIVARNGTLLTPVPDPVAAPPRFTRDDTITYRLTKNVPSGDAERLTIRDWFPQPVLSVATLGTTIARCGVLPPALDQICFVAPDHIAAPALTIDNATNSVILDFGNLDDAQNRFTPIEIYVTLKVTRTPFADGLFLTNETEECESNSYGVQVCQSAIAQFELTEPLLRIRKGILCSTPACSDSGKKRIAGEARPRVACNTCPRVTGATSANVASLLRPTADVDAGDTLTYAVVIENLGKGREGAFDVIFEDVLSTDSPAKILPSSICLTRGDGTSITHERQFSDKRIAVALSESIEPSTATNGRNLVILTYQVQVDEAAKTPFGSCVANTATLTRYSNIADGANFVTAGFTAGTKASTSSCMDLQSLEKQFLGTSESHTSDVVPYPLAIGEIIRYRLRFRLPEGSARLRVDDSLPSGLEIVALPEIRIVNGQKAHVGPLLALSSDGLIEFDVFNEDSDADCEYLEIDLTVLASNVFANNLDDVKPNSFTVRATSLTTPVKTKTYGPSNTIDAIIVEPVLRVEKVIDLEEDRAARYKVTIRNVGTSTAFEVVMVDTIGAGVWTCMPNAVGFMATKTTGDVGAVTVSSGRTQTPRAMIASIAPGATVELNYEGEHLDLNLPPDRICSKDCSTLGDVVDVTGTSLPADGTDPLSAGKERIGLPASHVDDYYATASGTLCSRICGRKYHDLNGDGIFDEKNEPVIAGWQIISDPAETSRQEAVTAIDGTYCFAYPTYANGVTPPPSVITGAHTIIEEQREGWKPIQPGNGRHIVTQPAGGKTKTADFGNQKIK